MEREIKLVISKVLYKHLYESELELESWRINDIIEDLYTELWEYIKDFD